jgi:hypothetical protein
LALVPGGAHLLELSNKIALDQERYMTVQVIYRGWSFLGITIVGGLLANVAGAISRRNQAVPMLLAATAAVLLAMISGQPGNGQLGGRAGKLARFTDTMGIFPCRELRSDLSGTLRKRRVRPFRKAIIAAR